jgi:hypothetical protein
MRQELVVGSTKSVEATTSGSTVSGSVMSSATSESG